MRIISDDKTSTASDLSAARLRYHDTMCRTSQMNLQHCKNMGGRMYAECWMPPYTLAVFSVMLPCDDAP